MIVKPRGTVTIPMRPRGIGDLLGWARAVTQALKQLRDRSIVVNATGGGRTATASVYTPWKPQFFTEGTEPSVTYKCRFNLGTLNNVAAGNWDAEHTLPSDDSVRFVILEVTSADGKVTGLNITLQTGILDEDFRAKDTPPVLHKILLGVVSKNTGMMIENTNLNASAALLYIESKVAPAVGAEPFSRWWRWEHTRV